MVLENSYPTTIGWARDTVPAVLWTSHAGQETGNALADVLFGDHNPAGRLTQTWYASETDLPDITDYDVLRNGTTYQYYDGDPVYAFGHGPSFEYSGIRLSSTTLKDRAVTVSVDVTNTGARAGDEVVQLYTHQRRSATRSRSDPCAASSGSRSSRGRPGPCRSSCSLTTWRTGT